LDDVETGRNEKSAFCETQNIGISVPDNQDRFSPSVISQFTAMYQTTRCHIVGDCNLS